MLTFDAGNILKLEIYLDRRDLENCSMCCASSCCYPATGCECTVSHLFFDCFLDITWGITNELNYVT